MASFVNPLGISIGDVTGIGPEVTLKALAALPPASSARFLLIGDPHHLLALNKSLGSPIPLVSKQQAKASDRFLIDPELERPFPERLDAGAPEAARAAYEWVRVGAQRCLAGELTGLVTAPVNKEAIVRAGIKFIGQTELLSGIAGTTRTAMMLLGPDDRNRWLRVVLATTHVAIKDVPAKLTREKIELAIEMADHACRLLRLGRRRIAVCGLNPHAGEGGNMGTEEITTISPAVEAARSRGIDAHGPASADALFYSVFNGDYDAVVAMYHDQGLAPLKMVAFENGINWTVGLPFIRTSPDHGTAYDIAGQGKAKPSSMLAAINLALQLAT